VSGLLLLDFWIWRFFRAPSIVDVVQLLLVLLAGEVDVERIFIPAESVAQNAVQSPTSLVRIMDNEGERLDCGLQGICFERILFVGNEPTGILFTFRTYLQIQTTVFVLTFLRVLHSVLWLP